MPSHEISLSERVQSAYMQLSAVASDLNAVSDELGKSIADLDLALKKLNLGVSVWVALGGWCDEQNDYYHEELGYAKIGGKWGIALRTVSGNHSNPPEDEVEELWLFNDGPRNLRLSAIGKIPELLERLSTEAIETAKKIKGKLAEAQEVAEAVKSAANINRVPFKSKPVLPPMKIASAALNVGAIREAILQAMQAGGSQMLVHALEEGLWSGEGNLVSVQVAMSDAMIDVAYTSQQAKLSEEAASRVASRAIKVRLVGTMRQVRK
jgi:hypothetical protein